MPHDPVNHPEHYTSHPSGIECIQITEHMGFNLGNATKYVWRADLKGDAIENLEKAVWYIQREIERRKALAQQSDTEANPVTRAAEAIFGRPLPEGVRAQQIKTLRHLALQRVREQVRAGTETAAMRRINASEAAGNDTELRDYILEHFEELDAAA